MAELIGEPVTRPNGWKLSLWQDPSDRTIFVRDGPMTTCFLEDQILRLGEGDYQQGLRKIGQTYFNANPVDIFSAVDDLADILSIDTF